MGMLNSRRNVHALNKLINVKKNERHMQGVGGWISNNDYGSRLILQLRRMTVDVAGRLEIIVPRQGRRVCVVQSGIARL